MLYTSKTHSLRHRPQKIKITSNKKEVSGQYASRHFCPFAVLRKFMQLRGGYETEEEQFFVFHDKQPVRPLHASNTLRIMIQRLGLNEKLYSMHSFRIGRTSDLIEFNYSLDEVQRMGRWRSNSVLRYIRS